MRLYKLKERYLGKDLDDEAISGFMVAKDDWEVYTTLAESFDDGYYPATEEEPEYDGWAEYYSGGEDVQQRILKNHGDFDEDYMGEFYDIKHGWEDMGEITEGEIATLKKLGILK